MKICGMQGVSLIDFPGKVASVVFLGGCNFRCPFCHNPDLVLRPQSQADIAPDEALLAIQRRRSLIDGVVITGGEPLLNGTALSALLQRLHDSGLAVKLDTNGYETDALQALLASGYVNYVAMDVKTSPERYTEATGRTLDVSRILASILALNESGIMHEFRTTCVPGLVELDDVAAIASMVGPHARYVLQQYRTAEAVLDPAYQQIKPHSAETIESFAATARRLAGTVSVRGA